MKTITFITGNQHKADYLSRMLGLPLKHRAVDLTEIQSTSLEEVVEYKVRQAYVIAKCPVLVEDVALGFTALDGLPGPFIKFFVEAPNGLENLCRMLDGFDDRSARANRADRRQAHRYAPLGGKLDGDEGTTRKKG